MSGNKYKLFWAFYEAQFFNLHIILLKTFWIRQNIIFTVSKLNHATYKTHENEEGTQFLFSATAPFPPRLQILQRPTSQPEFFCKNMILSFHRITHQAGVVGWTIWKKSVDLWVLHILENQYEKSFILTTISFG